MIIVQVRVIPDAFPEDYYLNHTMKECSLSIEYHDLSLP
jgi:hypothetical protein